MMLACARAVRQHHTHNWVVVCHHTHNGAPVSHILTSRNLPAMIFEKILRSNVKSRPSCAHDAGVRRAPDAGVRRAPSANIIRRMAHLFLTFKPPLTFQLEYSIKSSVPTRTHDPIVRMIALMMLPYGARARARPMGALSAQLGILFSLFGAFDAS